MTRKHKWQLPLFLRINPNPRRIVHSGLREDAEWRLNHCNPCDCGSRIAQYVCESCDEGICGKCARYAYWLPDHVILCPGCYALFSDERES